MLLILNDALNPNYEKVGVSLTLILNMKVPEYLRDPNLYY